MAYFSNGTEGDLYYDHYCAKCEHGKDHDNPCPIWNAHLLFNYDECNNKGSILHMLIPRDGIENKQCFFFTRRNEELPFDKT